LHEAAVGGVEGGVGVAGRMAPAAVAVRVPPDLQGVDEVAAAVNVPLRLGGVEAVEVREAQRCAHRRAERVVGLAVVEDDLPPQGC
jgi:hypothetical protein